MGELAAENSQALVLPATGELVDLTDVRQVARAYDQIQILEAKLREAKRSLRAAAGEVRRREGTSTFAIPGIGKMSVSAGKTTVYDAQTIEHELRELGMPEERIRDIVTEEVSYKLNVREAKRAAAANEEYARVIEANSETRETLEEVSFSRSGV